MKPMTDMDKELFNEEFPEGFCSYLPRDTEENYLKVLRSLKFNQRADALFGLIQIYRNRGRLKEMVSLMAQEAQDVSFRGTALIFMIKEARRSQIFGQWELADEICRAMPPIDKEFLNYQKWTLWSYTLNYLKRFSEAEMLLRRAINLKEDYYLAWKYLGTSLEHQGYFEEAAEAYYQAVLLSDGEDENSKKYLDRLLERYPFLRQIIELKWYSCIRADEIRHITGIDSEKRLSKQVLSLYRI